MKTFKYIGIAALAFGMMTVTSCSDDNDASTTAMSITQVYLEDADAKDGITDRPVEFARLGQLIRIEGSGFSGLKRVYVNGYKTEFNNAMLTDNNLWITLSGNTPIAQADTDVRNTIQLWKSDGNIYTYSFTIRAAAPSVTSFNCTLPQAGETVVVYGSNLQETTEVTLPSGTIISGDAITNADEDEDGEWFSFVMPNGETKGGSITVVCANGTAISPAMFNANDAYIINYDGLGTQGYWSWTETGSMCNNTDLVDDPLNSGRGNVAMVIPQRLIDNGGIAAGKTRATEWWTAGNDNAEDDWQWMVNAGIFSTSTPVSEIGLQFDVYCPEAWSGTGQIEFTIQNNASFTGYGTNETKSESNQVYVWVPWLDTTTGTVTPYKTTGWTTVTIPLSEFSKYALAIKDGTVPTFSDVVTDRNTGSYRNFGFGFVNTDITIGETEFPASVFSGKIYIDNLRLVNIATYEVSDFE